MKFVCGVKEQVDVRDFVATCTSESAEFPESFSLFEDKLFPKVKNQGEVGSCVAHSLSTLIEYFKYKQDDLKTQMSTSFIYGNREQSSYKGSGMIIRDAIKNVKDMGDCEYEKFPYNFEVPNAIDLFANRNPIVDSFAYPQRINEYYRLNSKNAIKQHLMTVGPVVFAIDWKEPYEIDSDYVLQVYPQSESCGGHCMIIYGWDDNYGWRVQNSWGKSFGKDGRFFLPFYTQLMEAWGITDVPLSEETNLTVTQACGAINKFSKLLNWISNLILKIKKGGD